MKDSVDKNKKLVLNVYSKATVYKHCYTRPEEGTEYWILCGEGDGRRGILGVGKTISKAWKDAADLVNAEMLEKFAS